MDVLRGASRMANKVGRKIETSIVDKKKGTGYFFCALIHTAGHVAGQAVLIADQRRKNGFEVSERETGTFYFFRSAGSMRSGGISLRKRARHRSNRPATRREMVPDTFFFFFRTV